MNSVSQYAGNMQGLGAFGYNAAVPDMGSYALNPDGLSSWAGDPNAMANLSGFWDDMMWDTNPPDMAETPFGFGVDMEYQNAAQNTGAPCWMQGN